MKDKLETISNLFEGKEIRSIWDENKEDYYFSVVDVVYALTDSSIPKRYWSDLKKDLLKEGSQLYEKIVQLKMKTKEDLEMKLGRSVISKDNNLDYKYPKNNDKIEENKNI
ncbi:MAG: hypothetical protein IKZ96_00415 [Bacilli bacterium]|nr:hypothetical protein [Bacilli bacterium]